jgi:hypothetical protein
MKEVDGWFKNVESLSLRGFSPLFDDRNHHKGIYIRKGTKRSECAYEK